MSEKEKGLTPEKVEGQAQEPAPLFEEDAPLLAGEPVEVEEFTVPVPEAGEGKIVQSTISPADAKELYAKTLEVVKERMETFAKLLTFAVSKTTHRDWVLYGEAPYLKASGAKKIARFLGLKFTPIKERREWFKTADGEPYYIWWITYQVEFRGEPLMIAEGGCSSRKKFFAYDKKTGWKRLEDIDAVHIKRAAISNAIRAAVLDFLPLESITFEQLKKIIGEKEASKIPKVDFGALVEKKARGDYKNAVLEMWAKIYSNKDLEVVKKLIFEDEGIQVDEATQKQLNYLYAKAKQALGGNNK